MVGVYFFELSFKMNLNILTALLFYVYVLTDIWNQKKFFGDLLLSNVTKPLEKQRLEWMFRQCKVDQWNVVSYCLYSVVFLKIKIKKEREQHRTKRCCYRTEKTYWTVFLCIWIYIVLFHWHIIYLLLIIIITEDKREELYKISLTTLLLRKQYLFFLIKIYVMFFFL